MKKIFYIFIKIFYNNYKFFYNNLGIRAMIVYFYFMLIDLINDYKKS